MIPQKRTASSGEKLQKSYKKMNLQTKFKEIENSSIEYPEYYLKPFHAYTEGNLCWLAACEAEWHDVPMALRVYPKERITAIDAQQRLRDSYTKRCAIIVKNIIIRMSNRRLLSILDALLA